MDMQDAACDVHLGQGQAAGYRYPPAMPEYQQEKVDRKIKSPFM